MRQKHIGIITGILLLAAVLLPCGEAPAKMVSIATDNVNMRAGPGTSYKTQWQLGRGFPLLVLKKKGNWFQVRDFEGTIGWVHGDLTSSDPYMVVKVNKNSQKRINIRSGPGTKYRIVAKAYYGVVLQTIQQKHGWVEVAHEKGAKGWVKRNLVWGW